MVVDGSSDGFVGGSAALSACRDMFFDRHHHRTDRACSKAVGFSQSAPALARMVSGRWRAVQLSLSLLHCPAHNAPAVEASLIGYLWPLLIVVGSAFLPGERLGWQHITGVLAGLAGTVLIVSKNSLSLNDSFAFGYGAALLSAFTWSAYSLLSRRLGAVPTDVVTGFCAITAILSLICHLALEQTVWPQGTGQWLAVAGLGLLPVGAAFYAWDFGIKRGDIRVLGTASYAAPLLSTLILIASGVGRADWRIASACVLITGGAVVAAKDLLFARARREGQAEE